MAAADSYLQVLRQRRRGGGARLGSLKINMFSDRHKSAKSSRGKHATWDFILATQLSLLTTLAFLSIYTGGVCCFFSQVFKDISGYAFIQKAYYPLQADGSLQLPVEASQLAHPQTARQATDAAQGAP